MGKAARTVAILGLAFALAACGGDPQSKADGPAETAQVAGPPPPAAFAQCLSCHTVEPGRNMIGPSLFGVLGKRAGSAPGFTYSNALQASRVTWDAKTLDAWLAGPAVLIPGNKMMFAGLHDPARRKEVIDYLAAHR
jgi:cytochrome c